jgi:hypothetical protein
LAADYSLSSGTQLGTIKFAGNDGTDTNSLGASIDCYVDGTPGANDMPGRLTFSTTADGASSPTERMRLNSSGQLWVGTSSGTHNLDMGQQLLSTSTTETKSIYRFGNASGLKRKFNLITVAADRTLFSIACGTVKAAFEITVFLTGEKQGISGDREFIGKWSVVRGPVGTFTIANVYSAGSAGAATVTASGDNVDINAIFSVVSGGGCFVEIKGLLGTGNGTSSESGFTVTMPAI